MTYISMHLNMFLYTSLTERSSKRTPRRKEIERRQQIDVERWLKNKFREGFATMREAFEAKDPKNDGSVGTGGLDIYLPYLTC